MPLVNYVLITIEIRSELPLRAPWRLTMIEWPLLLLDVYSTHHFQQFMCGAQSTASSQSLLRRKRLTVGSRITHKCQLEGVTVTQVLKQFPISNAADHISGPRSSFLTGISVCTSTQRALQHIKNSASHVWGVNLTM